MLLCDKYYDLKSNKDVTDFIFFIDDIPKPYDEGGFGLTGLHRPYLDELVKLIDNQDEAIIEMVDANRFRLTSVGIDRCKDLYRWMP